MMTDTFQPEHDPRFHTLLEEQFAVFICEHICSETNIPFMDVFHHEYIVEYINATRHPGVDSDTVSLDEYINIEMGQYQREDELYEIITGIPVSQETLRSRRSYIAAEYHRLLTMKCINDYDRRIAALNLPNFIDM
jgi:hypothetical protein